MPYLPVAGSVSVHSAARPATARPCFAPPELAASCLSLGTRPPEHSLVRHRRRFALFLLKRRRWHRHIALVELATHPSGIKRPGLSVRDATHLCTPEWQIHGYSAPRALLPTRHGQPPCPVPA